MEGTDGQRRNSAVKIQSVFRATRIRQRLEEIAQRARNAADARLADTFAESRSMVASSVPHPKSKSERIDMYFSDPASRSSPAPAAASSVGRTVSPGGSGGISMDLRSPPTPSPPVKPTTAGDGPLPFGTAHRLLQGAAQVSPAAHASAMSATSHLASAANTRAAVPAFAAASSVGRGGYIDSEGRVLVPPTRMPTENLGLGFSFDEVGSLVERDLVGALNALKFQSVQSCQALEAKHKQQLFDLARTHNEEIAHYRSAVRDLTSTINAAVDQNRQLRLDLEREREAVAEIRLKMQPTRAEIAEMKHHGRLKGQKSSGNNRGRE
eukprot:g3887.t1